ncbi:hypothetical protein BCR34DRAFT_572690 [Clohesyomyces aquaticus]|uniref:Uncharacterized protein n=1 Tax=Clohesyomyces aquaticus TaxID=1231657 RepID=A0A1Y1Z2G3_9PLEO|nr:hypothetical protein BCR34DRAFT_572690 [Clohesyomyces aquaticus]
MASNWITHTPSSTPLIITNEDITHVALSRSSEFYQIVQQEFLYGATKSGGPLPTSLQENTLISPPNELSDIIAKAVAEGIIMDCGWLEDYWSICERVSGALGGYPRSCLKQWRSIRDGVSRRMDRISSPIPEPKKQKNIRREPFFRFLDLPEHIRHRIYDFLIPHGTLTLTDWAFSCVPKSVFRRTEYNVPDENNQPRRTTYLLSYTHPPSRLPNLNIMLASRTLYQETASILYGSTFAFCGTASSALAFLHDHMKVVARVKKVEVRYTTTSKTRFLGCVTVSQKPPPTLKTSFVVWRNIVQLLRMSATGLEDFELVVDKGFWEKAGWEGGAESVMRDVALCETPMAAMGKKVGFQRRNFLVEVAKLAGVNLRLVIEGTGQEQARRGFRKDLEKVVCERMRMGDYVAEKGTGCMCRKRLLSEACAWGVEGKRRKL